MAYSSDGIHWTRYGFEPVFIPSRNIAEWDGEYMYRPSIIKFQGVYHMFYSGSNGQPIGSAGNTTAHGIGHASSFHGINWTKDPDNPIFYILDGVAWRNSRTYTPSVLLRSFAGTEAVPRAWLKCGLAAPTQAMSAQSAMRRFPVRPCLFPSSKLFREIYGEGKADFQLQGSVKLFKYMEGWGNLDWFSKRGHSIGFDERTKIAVADVSAGVNFLYASGGRQTLYLGIGPSWGRIRLKNDSPGDNKTISKNCFGEVVKAGMYYGLTECLYLNFFVDYFYQRAHFERHVNIGGIKTGAGIGVRF